MYHDLAHSFRVNFSFYFFFLKNTLLLTTLFQQKENKKDKAHLPKLCSLLNSLQHSILYLYSACFCSISQKGEQWRRKQFCTHHHMLATWCLCWSQANYCSRIDLAFPSTFSLLQHPILQEELINTFPQFLPVFPPSNSVISPLIVTPASTTATPLEILTFEVLHFIKPRVHEELINISKTFKIHGLIMDFFCTSGLSVADELHIPSYFFITSGACFLALYLHLPTLHQNTTKSFKDMKEHFLNVPELLPVLATDMPQPFLERDNKAYQYSLDFATQVPQAAGIMINTFEFLESKFVRAISDGLCVPDNPTPPIYCIGSIDCS